MTKDEEKLAAKLFEVSDPREGKDRLTVRFDPTNDVSVVYYGPDIHKYRKRIPGAVVLRYREEPAKTPTGGKYVKKSVRVRTVDGRHWVGLLKKGTDVVRLRLED